MDIKENWREITISEMAELMQSCNTDHSAFWTSFAEDFETAGKAKINRVNQITLQASMIYFLTTVAALQEKANGQAPSLEELKSIYHLARFANNDSSKGEYWYYRCLASTININTEVYKNINLGDTKQCQMFVEQFYNAQLSPFIRTIEENPVEVSLDRFLNILIKESPSINDQEPLSVPLENLRKFLDENWGAWIQGKTIYQCTTQLLTDEDVFEFSQQIPNDSYHAMLSESDIPPATPEPAEAAEPQGFKTANPEKNSAELWEQIKGSFAESAVERLNDGVLQMIFTGAPGTGKTYFAKLIARYLGELQTWLNPHRAYTLVQFHPSYDYTDFVEGLRPVQPGGAEGRMAFVKLDGAFKSFCRMVLREGNPEAVYFFLIDEINRAELPKVFGELMYYLEADKRGAENRVRTQYQNLPAYELDPETGTPKRIENDEFSDGFYIPENVRILGTMNDIDRSAESMDFALRRCFEWRTAEVTQERLETALEKMGLPSPGMLAGRTMRLNQALLNQGAR